MDDTEAQQLSELMRRYSLGEDEVFGRLYALMSARLYRFCVRLAGSRPDADDLLQETFLRIHRARATYLPGANAMHWAFAVARSAHLDRMRYRRRRPEERDSASDAAADDVWSDERYSPETMARTNELAEVVTLELRRMSPKNRLAFTLLQEEGLSVKEAAAVLGTTPDVVKQRAHRAYQRLRDAVGDGGWEKRDGLARGSARNRGEFRLRESWTTRSDALPDSGAAGGARSSRGAVVDRGDCRSTTGVQPLRERR